MKKLILLLLTIIMIFLTACQSITEPPEPTSQLIEYGIVTDNAYNNCFCGITTNLPWRLYDDGTLVLEEGSICWKYVASMMGAHEESWSYTRQIGISPWYDMYFEDNRNIKTIIFTGSVTGGRNLVGLFGLLSELQHIENIHYLDTSRATNISFMFQDTFNLKDLDLSSWDVRLVEDTISMFERSGITNPNTSNWALNNLTNTWDMFRNTENLTHLDLSGWDVRNMYKAQFWFSGATSLQEITLGENFVFESIIGDKDFQLPPIQPTETYTDYWQNVDNGTTDNPQGEYIFINLRTTNDKS